jgi:hypothetical protein
VKDLNIIPNVGVDPDTAYLVGPRQVIMFKDGVISEVTGAEVERVRRWFAREVKEET